MGVPTGAAASAASKASSAATKAESAASKAESAASKAENAAAKTEGVVDKAGEAKSTEEKASGALGKAQEGIDAADQTLDKLTGGDGEPQVKEGEHVGSLEEGGPQPGEKIAPGMTVDENGNAKEDNTQRLARAAGKAVAAYYTGGNEKAMEGVDKIMDTKMAKRATETLDNTPGVKQAADLAEKSGALETVEAAEKGYMAFKNGDVKGMAEAAKTAKEGSKKTRKTWLIVSLVSSAPIIIVVVIFMVIMGPVIGGFMDIVDKIETFGADIEEAINDYLSSDYTDAATVDEIQDIIANNVENYDSLSEQRQALVAWGLSGLHRAYAKGGKPTGAGMDGFPVSGLDCSGFVQWVYWSAIGDPLAIDGVSTQTLTDLIGSTFEEITEDELQPGDIALKFKGGSGGGTWNHTGVYLGNGMWVHDSGHKEGVKVSNYKNFTVFLRYKGLS